MIKFDHSNFHVEYMDVVQHWCSDSESFAGGDGLVTALFNGWEIQRDIYVEQKYYAGMRQVTIYRVKLQRGDETMEMPVLDNPYINRLMMQSNYRLIPVEQGDEARK